MHVCFGRDSANRIVDDVIVVALENLTFHVLAEWTVRQVAI